MILFFEHVCRFSEGINNFVFEPIQQSGMQSIISLKPYKSHKPLSHRIALNAIQMKVVSC